MIAPETTYWQIVRKQFRRHRTAVFGLYVVVLLFLLAIGAPLLATSSPFALRTAEGWSFPWLRDLLDQNRWQSGVDLFFNLALVFVLPVALLYALLRRRRRTVLAVSGAVFAYCFVSVVGPQGLVESDVGKVLFFPQHLLRYSHPKADYLGRVRKPHFDLALAQQRVARYRTRLEQVEAELAALTDRGPGEREGAETDALRLAARDKVDSARTRLELWSRRLEQAEAQAADPRNDYVALMPPIGFHHEDQERARTVEEPLWTGWGTSHFLGTDKNGRDVLARILYGTRVSLTIGVIAVAIYCTIGTIVGSLMGFFGGKVDMLLMRFVEIMMCFPTLAFILIIVGVFGRSIFLIMIAIGVVQWSGVARLVRGQFLSERNLDYVAAARALGIPTHRIVFKHVLPNAIHPMFVAATFGVASAILFESGLAFLGLGDAKVPSWGQILLEGRQTMELWLILGPGFAIFLTVTVLNLVGEGLRDALDPKLRQ